LLISSCSCFGAGGIVSVVSSIVLSKGIMQVTLQEVLPDPNFQLTILKGNPPVRSNVNPFKPYLRASYSFANGLGIFIKNLRLFIFRT